MCSNTLFDLYDLGGASLGWIKVKNTEIKVKKRGKEENSF